MLYGNFPTQWPFADQAHSHHSFGSQHTRLPETITEAVYAYLGKACQRLLIQHTDMFGNDIIHCSFSKYYSRRSEHRYSHQANVSYSNILNRPPHLETCPSVQVNLQDKHSYCQTLHIVGGSLNCIGTKENQLYRLLYQPPYR